MGLNYYSSSPVVLPPQNTNHHHHLMHQSQHQGGAVLEPSPAAFQRQPSFKARKFISKYPRPPSLNYQAQTSNGVAGRKRSREDIGDDLQQGISQTQPKPEPIMGPEMTLIYPNDPALTISPESQTGTWMEETATDDAFGPRPQMVARKSQRRVPDGLATADSDEIDPVVRQLGIGWKRLSENQQSAIAGSETFIRKQFSLNDPKILLFHEGLGIYVVRSDPAGAKGYWQQWWLFREDLKSCRFLCNDDADLFRRLSNKRRDQRGIWIPDILAEGPETFAKDVTPSPTTAITPINGVASAPSVELMNQQSPCEDVEMDCDM